MRQYLNDTHRMIFDRYLQNAVAGGCDLRQAESIAKERTLKRVMEASAAIHAVRERVGNNISRLEPNPCYRDGNND